MPSGCVRCTRTTVQTTDSLAHCRRSIVRTLTRSLCVTCAGRISLPELILTTVWRPLSLRPPLRQVIRMRRMISQRAIVWRNNNIHTADLCGLPAGISKVRRDEHTVAARRLRVAMLHTRLLTFGRCFLIPSIPGSDPINLHHGHGSKGHKDVSSCRFPAAHASCTLRTSTHPHLVCSGCRFDNRSSPPRRSDGQCCRLVPRCSPVSVRLVPSIRCLIRMCSCRLRALCGMWSSRAE